MRNSIRTRLTVAFIGLAIGPLLVVGVILAWQGFTTQQQQALNLQAEVARHVAIEVTAFFEELENELRLVSKAQVWPGLDRNEQHSILKMLMSQDVFEELVLLDNQGQEQIHLSRLGLSSTRVGNHAEADEFVIPHTSGQVYYGPVRFSEATGEPLMTIAVPLLDIRTGLADGVLVSEVRLKKIWELIADIRVSEGQSVYIVDAQGKIVAHRIPSVVLRSTSFDVPDQDGIQPGLTGESTILAVDTARFGQQEFNVVAEQAVPDALAQAFVSMYVIVAIIVVALVAASSLGFLIVRQIVQPVQAMATTAQAVSAGDLSQQVEITSHDELGVLAGAFNNMTRKLRRLINDLEQQIVERKQAEQALRESEERLRQIASSLREAIWLRDVQTRQVLYVNPAFEELTGRTCESFYENRDIVIDAIHPDDKEGVIKALDQRFEGVPFDKEHRIIHLDGSVRWISSRSFPVRNEAGEVYRWASTMEDITERKWAEEEIRKLNEKLEQLVARRTQQIETVVEVSQQLTGILDLPTLLREVVTITKETFGYYHVHIYVLEEESKTLVMAEGYGQAGQEMKHQGHQIPLDAPTSLVARAARQREIVLVNDVRQATDWLPNPLLPDTYSEMAIPIIAEEAVIGVLDVQSDQVAGLDEGDKDLLRSLANQIGVALTNAQLYQTEKNLRQAEAEKAQELAKLNADLKAAQAELLRQERLATLGQLTATVSHEIRNPLGTIRASAFALDRQIRDKGPGVQRALDRIERNITRCDNIITELLDYTRMPNPSPKSVPFDDWLNQVLDEQTLPKGITLSRKLAAGIEIPLDPERFRRVIINLFDNACQAMLESDISNDTPLVLSIQSEVINQELKISISDTGSGIPPDVLPHIFDPLYSTKGFGVGLGLPIVKEIIKQHQGKIEITSEMGKGTQAILWLPLVESLA